jgi:hypothetical protein
MYAARRQVFGVDPLGQRGHPEGGRDGGCPVAAVAVGVDGEVDEFLVPVPVIVSMTGWAAVVPVIGSVARTWSPRCP